MNRLQQKLSEAHPMVFSLFAIIAAFCTYSCMYAFRKPYTAAAFADEAPVWGMTYKSLLVITQVLGYMLSKFVGIKVISEMKSGARALWILALIGLAELSLLGFGLVSAPYNMIFLFLNGLPLGMIWGLVFSYLEGRKFTEIMGLGLCSSFIFASGITKDVGKALMQGGVSEFWMPAATGLVFAIPAVFFIWMLNQLPPPTEEDVALRTVRTPMNGQERVAFFKRFSVGLILLVTVYTMLTAYRSFRDDFLADIWIDLRGADAASVDFSATEVPISIGVLLLLMLLVLVKDNIKALMINHFAILAGVLLAGISTWAFQRGLISDYLWLLMTGFGTYMAYIPFNAILFDRMIAAFRYASNVGFLIYLADSFGYLGNIAVLVYKDFGGKELSWAEFFTQISYALALIGLVGMILSAIYFLRKHRLLITETKEPKTPSLS
ncbi:MAG: DUF5690 family protein [Bacteroidota bacterium]